MATIKAKFRASSIEGKRGTIYYQVLHKRVVRQIKSDYVVMPYEWRHDGDHVVVDDANPERAKELRLIASKIDYEIRQLRKLAKSIEATGQLNLCDGLVVEAGRLPKVVTLFEFLQTEIELLRKSGRKGTANNYLASLNSFVRFRDGEDLILDNLSPQIIEEYEAYLKSEKVSMNSISFYMRNLRAGYNKAVKEELIESQNPFRRVYTGVDKTVKQALTLDDIKRIRSYEGVKNTTCEFARDMFLFSFYARGMAFVDMAYLLKSDLKNGVLSYQKRKKGQPLHIKWETCMQEIADKYYVAESPYLLPIINNLSDEANDTNYYKGQLDKVNNWLKRLSVEMKFATPLTMNIARHSWALVAKTKSIPLPIISQGLGHDNEAVTMRYLESLECSYVDGANRMIIDDVIG